MPLADARSDVAARPTNPVAVACAKNVPDADEHQADDDRDEVWQQQKR